jgi:2-oxoglutarate dehydrogenase E2 component (dihydrolipoamide succinyltransferase)
VRRLAAEAGLSLDQLQGTGPGGRVTRADVATAAAGARKDEGDGDGVMHVPAPPAATPSTARHATAPAAAGISTAPAGPGSTAGTPMSGMRAVIADRMMQSLQTSAQLTSVVEVDLSAVVALRRSAAEGIRERLGVRLSLTAFFAKAAVEALRAFPLLNSAVGADGRSVVTHHEQHLGIAVDTDRGLMVPVIAAAGDLSLLGLSRRIEDLAARARAGTVKPDELSGGTFTLTNTGSRGALFDTPILVPGQVGILGTGAVVERPAVVRQADGEKAIAIRSIAYLALTYDHRLVDGADAARFLVAIKSRLEGARFETELG